MLLKLRRPTGALLPLLALLIGVAIIALPYTDALAAEECTKSITKDTMPPLAVGKPLPTFGGFTTDNHTVTRDSLLSPPGKKPAPDVLVLSFWATWCGPCVESLPILQQVVRKDREGVRVETLLIALKDEKTGPDLQAALTKMGITLPSLEDPHGVIGGRLGVSRAIPRTLIIDGQGIVRTLFVTECATDFAAELDAAIQRAANR
jgi:thiol-disulfide isomerase/thioredoxin